MKLHRNATPSDSDFPPSDPNSQSAAAAFNEGRNNTAIQEEQLMEIIVFGKDQDQGQYVETFDQPLQCADGQTYQLTVTDAVRQGTSVDQCVLCGHSEFYRVKDFPRVLGLVILLIAFGLFLATPGLGKYGWLFGVAGLDFVLYQIWRWKLVCYVCESQYRDVAPLENQVEYDLEHATHCKRKRWKNKAISQQSDD